MTAPATPIGLRIERRASESSSARAMGDAAVVRLTRLQSITAALSNTVTQDAVAQSVVIEAITALECDAGVVVVTTEDKANLIQLHEAGSLDPLMRSFENEQPTSSPGPYAEAVEKSMAIYLESVEEMLMRYPSFRTVGRPESHGAWIFLPLSIEGKAVGALAFGFRQPRKFTFLDRNFADTVSRYCAQALDRVRLRVAAAAALAAAGEARRMAEHANSAKTVFLRAMSHELRTPLNAISGYTEILEMGLRGPVNTAQATDLGRIKRAAAYLLSLINDVLTVARLEGAPPLRLASIPVNPVLTEVEALCALQAKAKGLTLTVTGSDGEIRVPADAERFQQILRNLVINALKFTAPNGVRVVGAMGKKARLGVTDMRRRYQRGGCRARARAVRADRQTSDHRRPARRRARTRSAELARAMHGDLTLQSIEESAPPYPHTSMHRSIAASSTNADTG